MRRQSGGYGGSRMWPYSVFGMLSPSSRRQGVFEGHSEQPWIRSRRPRKGRREAGAGAEVRARARGVLAADIER